MKSIVLLMICLATSITSFSQSFNTKSSVSGKQPAILGKMNKEVLSQPPYDEWFTKNYTAYQPNQAIINPYKEELTNYTIKAFMGTWCGDSKREVPKFYKLLAAAEFPLDRVTLVGVSRERADYKQSPGGEEEGLNIHRVPTFIFYKEGEEIGRIVESPVETFENDIASILQQQYTPNYEAVQLVDNTLKEMGLATFKKKAKKLAKKLRPITKNMFELNTYSTVLFFGDKKEEALAVAKLNILLFPDESRAYSSYGNKLLQLNETEDAIVQYEKALKLDPENKKLQDNLKNLKESL